METTLLVPIKGKTIEEQKKHFQQWYKDYFGEGIEAATPEENKSKAKKSNGRGAGKKEATEEVAAEANTVASDSSPDQNSAPQTATPNFTHEDCKNELQKILDTKTVDVARQLLQRFGANRIGEIKTADYPKFIEACKQISAE